MQHSADPLGKTKKGTRDVMYNMINVTNTSVCHGASKVAQWYRICNAGDVAWNPGLGRSLGGGHSNLLQYSCLENPTDIDAWQDIVHRVTKSWTQLK